MDYTVMQNAATKIVDNFKSVGNDINNLKDNVTDLKDNLTPRMTTAESDIVAIDGDLTSIEEASAYICNCLSGSLDPEDPNSGYAELADIRVGYDNTTYPNAGTAVRSQISELSSEIVEIKTVLGSEKEFAMGSENAFSSNHTCDNDVTWCVKVPLTKGLLKSVTFRAKDNTPIIFSLLRKENDTFSQVGESFTITPKKAGEIETHEISIKLEENDLYLAYCGKLYYSTSDTGYTLYQLENSTYNLLATLNNMSFAVRCEVFSGQSTSIGGEIHVAKNGKGDFETINEALNYAYTIESKENPINIIIHNGVYKEVLNIGGMHNISLIGVNRNHCIIRDDSGLYNNAPVRIEGNSLVKNLTLIATHKDNPNFEANVGDDYLCSYAIHVDDVHPNDDSEYLFRIENCYLYSEQNAAIGMGLQKNQRVEVVNCEIIKNISDYMYTTHTKANKGAFFVHPKWKLDSDEPINQKLVVDNCRIKTNKGNALFVEGSNANEHFEMTYYNNCLYSDELGKENVFVNEATGAILTNDSFGNNVEELNA